MVKYDKIVIILIGDKDIRDDEHAVDAVDGTAPSKQEKTNRLTDKIQQIEESMEEQAGAMAQALEGEFGDRMSKVILMKFGA